GKRLRSAFCYWGWRAAGCADTPEIIEVAAAFDFFQAAALIHDDLMDDSDTRRGEPALHRSFATLHDQSGWFGDARRFGAAAAILAGDLCLSWSDELLTQCGLPAADIARARPMFNTMRTQLMAGQYLDVLEQVLPADQGGGTVDRARRVITFKSAKYSVEHPLLIGGLLANASPEQLASYSDYALPLGSAFQLRDDLLGVFGDPERTGKPAGDDLREGKRTVLLAEALAQATPAQAETLRQGIGNPNLGGADITTLRDILVNTGAADRVEHLIAELVTQSRQALAAARVTTTARVILDQLITAATTRVA
ncbi:MAG: polyprenyl synthetase family protein, partial [Angustibacter sp.]